jgi:CheY-like chemotaxis protein
VLVVDDVETNLDVAKGLLLPYGISVDTAPGGWGAVEKVRAAGESDIRYDLVLMDHMMPGMDGLEAVRIIRNEIPGGYGKEVPIIALTANALAGNKEMFLANGFNDYISKPIDIMQLDTVLNTWVRDKQNAETLKEAETESPAAVKKQADAPLIPDGFEVEGIDLIQGRERYNGEGPYLEILRSWHLHTPALLKILRGLSLETLPEYTVTVHGLKGSSYGIFASGIGDKAEELEQAAKARNFTRVESENPAFIESVDRLLQAVGELLQKVASGKKAKQKVPAPDPVLLAKLLDAVRRYKSTLMEEVMAELESYEYESGAELVEWLRGQIDNLEYEAICGKLETVCPEGAEVS